MVLLPLVKDMLSGVLGRAAAGGITTPRFSVACGSRILSRSFASGKEDLYFPPNEGVPRKGSIPIEVEGYNGRCSSFYSGGPGYPLNWLTTYDTPVDPQTSTDLSAIARDEYNCPMQVPPEVSTTIKFTYYIPPQFFPFLKKLGDDTPGMKPYMDKLIHGNLTFDEYEEMFFKFAKPLKIRRSLISMPYRTPEEQARSEEVAWEGARCRSASASKESTP